jgi:hypothetical protein
MLMATRKGKSISVYLPLDLVKRLKASVARNRRTLTMEITIALERYLKAEEEAHGVVWEPEPEEEPKEEKKPKKK